MQMHNGRGDPGRHLQRLLGPNLRVEPFDEVFHFVVVSMQAAFTPTYLEVTSPNFRQFPFHLKLPQDQRHERERHIKKSNMSVNKSVLSSHKHSWLSSPYLPDLEMQSTTKVLQNVSFPDVSTVKLTQGKRSRRPQK